ncbi:parallel beta-helix repeat (two copies), partial [Desulfoluna spongiiphila]
MEMPSYRTTCPESVGFHKFSVSEKQTGMTGLLCRFVLTMVFLVMTASSVSAATQVSGDITKDTTWTLAGSPYVVTSSIRVQGTDGDDGVTTLMVNPGVEVKFNSNSGLSVGGSSGAPGGLVAVGTSDDQVVFCSNDGTNWQGIFFNNTTADETSVLNHCIVKNAGMLSGSSCNYSVCMENSSPSIRNSVISGSKNFGIRINSGSPDISDNVISDNGNCGIFLRDSCSPSITGNKVIGNKGVGIFSNNTSCIPTVTG